MLIKYVVLIIRKVASIFALKPYCTGRCHLKLTSRRNILRAPAIGTPSCLRSIHFRSCVRHGTNFTRLILSRGPRLSSRCMRTLYERCTDVARTLYECCTNAVQMPYERDLNTHTIAAPSECIQHTPVRLKRAAETGSAAAVQQRYCRHIWLRNAVTC